MRPTVCLLAFTLAAACSGAGDDLTAPPITAIIGGVPDGNGHPAVGAVLVLDLDGSGGPSANDQVCTGTFIGPNKAGTRDVVLTAAHCLIAPAAQLRVTFDADLTDGVSGPIAVLDAIPDPGFRLIGANTRDQAVLLLPAGSAAGITAAGLPAAGYLDARNVKNGLKGALFENVGYGITVSHKGHPPAFGGGGVRLVSTSPFMALKPWWLVLKMNADATGLGGDCFGDSGGPKFVPGQNLIVATVITGDRFCRSTSQDWRLDTPEARAFLGTHVNLP